MEQDLLVRLYRRGFETVLGDKVEVREYDKFKDTESLDSVVNNSHILFLCLPTPMNEDGSCNISIIEEVVEEVVKTAKKKKCIVVKSTVPPGTTKALAEKYGENGHDFVFNPEFLMQATFIDDFINQDRVFLGWTGKDPQSLELLNGLYEEFAEKQKTPAKIFNTTSKQAEMAKYIANSFLTTKVVFFNEMFQICNAVGVDYDKVIDLVKLDKRIGTSHMKVPGPDGQMGAGGPCFPKDTNALIAFAKANGVDPLVLESVWAKNLMVRDVHEWERISSSESEIIKKYDRVYEWLL